MIYRCTTPGLVGPESSVDRLTAIARLAPAPPAARDRLAEGPPGKRNDRGKTPAIGRLIVPLIACGAKLDLWARGPHSPAGCFRARAPPPGEQNNLIGWRRVCHATPAPANQIALSRGRLLNPRAKCLI